MSTLAGELEAALTKAAKRFAGRKPKHPKNKDRHRFMVVLSLGKSGRFNNIGRYLSVVGRSGILILTMILSQSTVCQQGARASYYLPRLS